MTDLESLLLRIDRAIASGRVSERRIGRATVNDGSLIADVRGGREMRQATMRKVEAWLDLFERDPDAALQIKRPDGRDESRPAA